jgi:hypothetical protein
MKRYEEFKELYSVYQDDEINPPDFYLIHPQEYKELVHEIYSSGGQPFGTDGKCYVDGVLVISSHVIERGCGVLAKNVVARNGN